MYALVLVGVMCFLHTAAVTTGQREIELKRRTKKNKKKHANRNRIARRQIKRPPYVQYCCTPSSSVYHSRVSLVCSFVVQNMHLSFCKNFNYKMSSSSGARPLCNVYSPVKKDILVGKPCAVSWPNRGQPPPSLLLEISRTRPPKIHPFLIRLRLRYIVKVTTNSSLSPLCIIPRKIKYTHLRLRLVAGGQTLCSWQDHTQLPPSLLL